MAKSITKYIQNARQKALDRDAGADKLCNIYFSGTTYSLWKAAFQPTSKYSKGLVLDAGSGRGAWSGIITRNAIRESLDIAPKANEQVTWLADITDMPQVPTERYDATICHQVLEHVPNPSAAICELFRTLKKGGTLVISAPHLSRQHELPHDYFRFTPRGLESLLRNAGFEIETITIYGGILSFLHHQFATVLIGLTSIFRPLLVVSTILNAPLSLASAKVDRFLDRSGLLAVGIVAVAHKPTTIINE
ncbi:class I SAM-dependent methyltransferase [Croceicoccus estronivorus]|uniref:class I SAM-dependent methyltransferase n=1 Tax=Croceicoccus estronivorus TaxID=1172626 RepID=UPI0009EDB218|nr:class I SAM-dependent methyltransferase [Croceicoccus estronivorus]